MGKYNNLKVLIFYHFRQSFHQEGRKKEKEKGKRKKKKKQEKEPIKLKCNMHKTIILFTNNEFCYLSPILISYLLGYNVQVYRE